MNHKRELSAPWRVVSWLLTGIMLFVCGCIAIYIGDRLNPHGNNKMITYAGFFIGMGTYPVIKEILLNLTQKHETSADAKTHELSQTNNEEEICNSSWNVAQRFSLELKKRTSEHPNWWNTYINDVHMVIAEDYREEDGQNGVNTLLQLTRCVDYATKNFLTEDAVLEAESRKAATSSVPPIEYANQLDTKLKILCQKIEGLESLDETRKEDLILLYKVGARMAWMGMYEYVLLKEKGK